MTQHTLHLGDCLDIMRTMPDCSVDAVVTDPPYGLSFMGKAWDYDVPGVDVWQEALRVLKPGGHMMAFAGTRTQHRMAVAIEDAGFEIRDMIAWCYGNRFPKSHNLDDAWAGWGTALKPALEPITMARKPFKGTVAANVLEHGTGALNVDGCRVHGPDALAGRKRHGGGIAENHSSYVLPDSDHESPAGRWPANLIHDGSEEVVGLFPEQRNGGANVSDTRKAGASTNILSGTGWSKPSNAAYANDTGSAARFFYTAKVTRAERQGVTHPTVKPLDLMAYLCRLVTPSGGTVLDPFMGSGTTIKAAISEGFNAIGIERDPAYFAMAEHRMNGAQLGLGLNL